MLTIGIDSVTLLEVTRQTIEVVTTLHLDQDYTEKALIDSGARGDFINIKTTKCLHLPWTELRQPITIRNVDGTQNNKGHITHQTILEMIIANKQQEVINIATIFPEYFEDNKQNGNHSIAILKAKISKQFDQLYGNHEKKDLTPKQLIPKHFHKYIKLFNKTTSECYPKPRSYDHKIHLWPDFKPIQQSLYSLNPAQMDLAKKFVDKNLKKGYIVSKSPMASLLFFVKEGWK